MRRLWAQLIIAGVTAFAIGVAYRYAWDDPSEARFANYMRSGVPGWDWRQAAWEPTSISIRGSAGGCDGGRSSRKLRCEQW